MVSRNCSLARLRISQHNVLTRAQTTDFETPSLVNYDVLQEIVALTQLWVCSMA
jgi:hypothetical protein